jgi:hypothetical protein
MNTRLRRVLAAAAAAGFISWGLAACDSSTTVVNCTGKNCPVQVSSRHDDQICGITGCAWYYWLYFNNGLFQMVPYYTWNRYSPGSYYATATGLYNEAGLTVFTQLSSETEDLEDSDASLADESYEASTENVADQVDAAEQAEADGDGDSEDENISDQEEYEPPDPVTATDEDCCDDDTDGDDDGGDYGIVITQQVQAVW